METWNLKGFSEVVTIANILELFLGVILHL